MDNPCIQTEFLDRCWKPVAPLSVIFLKIGLLFALWRHLIIPVLHEPFSTEEGDIIISQFAYLWSFVLFHLLFVFLFVSFILAMFVSPGDVPLSSPWKGKVPIDISEHDTLLLSEILNHPNIGRETFKVYKDLGADVREQVRRLPIVQTKGFDSSQNIVFRSCRKCKLFKPDRTHHCRRCKKCRLKMDHHCPWIMNCVGFHNQKYFILMLMYGASTALVYSCIMFPRMLESFRSFGRDDGDFVSELVVIVAWFAGFMMIYPLVLFTVFQFGLVFAGMTTIEFQEKIRISDNDEHSDFAGRNKCLVACIKFNRGWFQNFIQVFGESWSMWMFPWFVTNEDGTYYYSTGLEEEISMLE